MSIHDKSLHKCNGSCNAVDESSLEIFLSSETKDINVKVFSIAVRINEVENIGKYIFQFVL